MAATTRAWHAVDAAEAMTALGAGPDGLGAGEATARLALHGPNRLPAPPRRTALARLVAQIHNLHQRGIAGSSYASCTKYLA